jgi:hypothetical protein
MNIRILQSILNGNVRLFCRKKAEKNAALNMLMKQNTGRGDWDFDEKTLKATAVYELAADKLSCKAK